MKIALIKETKVPIDNRVAFSPKQMAQLQNDYPEHQFVVQRSDVRAFADEEYQDAGLSLVEKVDDCDILFGIKEAQIETLIPNKHYIFFGHIAKMQAYNRPLLQAFINKGITFTDYEYMVDDAGIRVCAFGWWAGIVGVYYTLRGYGLRHNLYQLPKPDRRFTLDGLTLALKSIPLPAIKILVTGNGRVSQGAQYILDAIGAQRLTEEQFLSTDSVSQLSYTVADVDKLVKRSNGEAFSWPHFTKCASEYQSDFMRWGAAADVLVCAHFWAPEAPVYLSEEDLRNPQLRIKMIGDVTCDIQGSVKSTLRSTTHDEPYFDYNPQTASEEESFSSNNNITVMAVDTCPNALAMDTSAYFGDMLMQHVMPGLLSGNHSDVVLRGTILNKGKLTERFAYLEDFANGK